MTAPRRWARLLLTATLITALPLTTSCSLTNNQQTQEQQEAQSRKQLHEDEENRLAQELSNLENVTHVEVGYSDVWPESGSMRIDFSLPIEYRNDEIKNQLNDQATEAAWLSSFSSLHTLSIYTHWHDPTSGGIDDPGYTPLLSDKGRAELTQRYGPRPN